MKTRNNYKLRSVGNNHISCRAVEKWEEKNGKAYSTKLCQNRLRQCVLCQKDSSENFDSAGALACRILLKIAVYVFETLQLTLEATWKRTQQFTMLRVFAWGKKFDWLQTLRNNFDPNNTQQHATGCAKWNSIGSCWPTMLRLFATVFYKSKLLCEKKHK